MRKHNIHIELVFFICFWIALVNVNSFAQITPDAPSHLNTNATTDAGHDYQPEIATDGLGNWISVWYSSEDLAGAGTDYDIFYAVSTNKGATWSSPALLNSNATSGSGSDWKAQIKTNGTGEWVVVWESLDDFSGAGTDADIFYSVSTNNGTSWSTAAHVNSDATTDTGDDKFPQLSTDGAGNWMVVWESDDTSGGSGTDTDVVYAVSTDDAASWNTPAYLNINATTDTLGDSEPWIVANGTGTWIAAWHTWESAGGVGTDLDIAYVVSSDLGITWSAPAYLNTFGSTDSRSDIRPQLYTDDTGVWIGVWQSDEDYLGAGTDWDFFSTTSSDNGVTWSNPVLLNVNGRSDGSTDQGIDLAYDGNGKWAAVFGSWVDIDGAGVDADIVSTISLDHGSSWSALGLVHTNATSDTEIDATPGIATDGLGDWIVVWNSSEDYSSAGTDWDIFTLTSTLTIGPIADTITPSIAGPTQGGLITFAVHFDQNVYDFNDVNDLIITAAGVTYGEVTVSGSLDTYTVYVAGVSGDGALSLAMDTNSDVNNLVWDNLASSVTSTPVIIDNIPPTLSIGAPSLSLTNTEPVEYVVTYSGADTILLDSIHVAKNFTDTVSPGTAVVTGTGDTRTVTLSGFSGDGTLGIAISGGSAMDSAGNSAVSAGPSTMFTVDNTPPLLTLSTPSAAASYGDPVTYTLTYTGYDSISLESYHLFRNSQQTATGTVTLSGSGATRTITVSEISGDGTIAVGVGANTATDNAGNQAESIVSEYFDVVTTVYADFDWADVEVGSESKPFNTFGEAISSVGSGNEVRVDATATDTDSNWTGMISKAVTLYADPAGIVRIGTP